MEKSTFVQYQLNKLINGMDEHGNNTDFPDSIMSDITTKGLLGKWTQLIYLDTLSCLRRYYESRRKQGRDIEYVRRFFERNSQSAAHKLPILEDLVTNDINGMEDIFIAVFGVGSKQVYVLRHFIELMQKETWDGSHMWDNAKDDLRLHKILFNNDTESEEK